MTTKEACGEYKENKYILIVGQGCHEFGHVLPTIGRVSSFKKTLGDDVTRAFERLGTLEKNASYSHIAFFAQIDEERAVNLQTRDVVLDILFTCGDRLTSQEGSLPMALALDCFNDGTK
eukprot:3739122-Rhodomonas_salina.2